MHCGPKPALYHQSAGAWSLQGLSIQGINQRVSRRKLIHREQSGLGVADKSQGGVVLGHLY